MFEQIAVPLDGSEIGEMAIPWAAEIAAIMNSRIYFVSVSQNESPEERRMRRSYIEHKAEILENQFEAAGGRFPIPKPEAEVLDGDAAAKIVDFTKQKEISLLILVSHGKSGIMSWAMGSTASRVLSRVQCPVLFVRAGKQAPTLTPLLQHILVALDRSPKAESIIPYAEELARKTAVQVTLLQVINPEREVVSIGGERRSQLPKFELDRLEREGKEYLGKIEIRFPPGRVDSQVCIGNPAAEIMQHAESHGVSLIAITTRGQTDSGEWQFGQITHKLMHSSKTPVLLARSNT